MCHNVLRSMLLCPHTYDGRFVFTLCLLPHSRVKHTLKLNGVYDEVVTIETKVNACVLLLFVLVFHQNATYEPYRFQFYNYQCITQCMILRWSHTSVICVCLRIVVSNICVFVLFVFVLSTQCC